MSGYLITSALGVSGLHCVEGSKVACVGSLTSFWVSESPLGGVWWLPGDIVWCFGDISHVFEIVNVGFGNLTGLGGCLNNFLVTKIMFVE